MRRWFNAFVMGATLFPVLDGMHTHGGVLRYTQPSFALMAWWVPLEFGAMWIIVAISVPMLELRVRPPRRQITTTVEVLIETALFATVYALTATLDAHASWLIVVLAVGLAARFALYSEPSDWVFVAASSVLGPLGETIVSYTGAFHYARPSLGLVPMWLPLLWAHGGFFARRWFRHPWLGVQGAVALPAGEPAGGP